MHIFTGFDDSDMLISTSTEITRTQNESSGRQQQSVTTPSHRAAPTELMPPHNRQTRADSMSAAEKTPQFDEEACNCKCNCARRTGRADQGLDIGSDYVILGDSGSSEDGFPQGEEGPEGYPPAFPWRGNGVEKHVDNAFGGFEITKDGFQLAGSEDDEDDCEPLRRSIILRDLTALDRTGAPTSLVNNEATSGEASVASSGFLPRKPETAQNTLHFIGSWDETSADSGYRFTGESLWLSPSRWSQRYDSVHSSYPKGIRDEGME